MIHIAIAEDQLLFRKGIITLLNSFKDVRVCLEATTGQELLDGISATKIPVHIALLDINMPVMNGIETLSEMRKRFPDIKNVILTVHEEDKYIHKLINEGANAYLAKNTEPHEVEKAIHAVIQNDYYFNQNTMRVMRDYKPGRSQKNSLKNAEEITGREKEVLVQICRENTSPEIAEKLFISESTVNGHRNNLLAKTGARNTAGLVLFAIRSGLFDPDFG